MAVTSAGTISPTSILANTGTHDITLTWYEDGTAVDVGTVTIGIVDEAGDTVVAAATAVTTDGADGTYMYRLATQTQVNNLTITWTESGGEFISTRLEVRGNHLFTEAEARAFHGSDLTSATTYPDADIAAARDRIMDEFEQICGVSFVRRYARESVAGNGGRVLWLGRPHIRTLIGATVSGTSVTVANVVVDPVVSQLTRTDGVWSSATVSSPVNVVVEYEHGHETVPGDIKRAALVLLRTHLVKDQVGAGLSDRAVSLTDEVGTVRLSMPSPRFGQWYGIPFVDTTLRRYSLLSPVF